MDHKVLTGIVVIYLALFFGSFSYFYSEHHESFKAYLKLLEQTHTF